jgi:rod shape-determining protein MreD
MRNIGGLVLLLGVALLLRSTALSSLAARGVVLDVLAFATVVWALRNGESSGATFGFLLGLAADLDAAHWMGRHTLALALIGYGVGRLNQTLMRDRAVTHFVLIVAATVLHQLWTLSFELGGLSGWLFLLGRVGLAAAVTAPLGTVLLGLVRRVSGRPIFGDVSFATDSGK